MEIDPATITTDQLETELARLESLIGRARRMQAWLVAEADRRQLPLADGSRTIVDWVAAKLDVTHRTARKVVTLTHTDVESGLSMDRTVALTMLAQVTGKPVHPHEWAGLDLAGVYRRISHHGRTRPVVERDAVEDRFVAIQPNLDSSSWRLWGQLPGTDGAVVEQALIARGDQFPRLPDGNRPTRGHRSADALVTLCAESLDNAGGDDSGGTVPTVTIVCDARDASASNGETGVTVVGGPRAGPQALEAVLCDGLVEIVAMDSDGVPLGVGQTTSTIPPRVRRYVLARDGGCTIDGCGSRYRLQPHHIEHRAWGGTHDTHNLATLCWFHHHRVIHGMGFTIDPESPPGRRRLKPPGTDPPG